MFTPTKTMLHSTIDLDCYTKGIMEVVSREDIKSPYIISKLEESKLPSNLYNEISQKVKELLTFRFLKSFYHNQRKIDHALASKKPVNESSLEKTDRHSLCFDLVSELTKRVYALYDGVHDTCSVIMGRAPSLKASRNFINRYFIYGLLDCIEKRFKYHSAYLMCLLHPSTEKPQAIPLYENEIPGVVIGGWVRRYFSSEKFTVKEKTKFALSLQNCKRAALAISELEQMKAIIEHQNSLLGKDYEYEEQTDYLVEVRNSVYNLTRKYYRGLTENEIPIWRTPSLSACYEKTSAELGSYGYFSEKFSANSSYYKTSASLQQGPYRTPISSIGFDLMTCINTVKQDILERDGKPVNAIYQQILEPFKVRAVTKAEAFPYQMGRLIQKPLHKRLRDEKGPFRLIGKTVTDEDINDVYSGTQLCTEEHFRTKSALGERPVLFTFFVAGDYRKATDNMHPSLPNEFIKAIAFNTTLSGFWIKVLQQTLGPHKIHYGSSMPDYWQDLAKHLKFDFFKEIDQEFGQLMGSPTSFPVLNIVNAAMLWTSVNEYLGKFVKWSFVLENWKPLFNGDDISFLSNPIHYRIWSDICKASGLSLSPGKNYCTREFININSTTFWCEERKVEGDFTTFVTFKKMFVLNSGLIKGQSKVLERSPKFKNYENDSLMPICDQLDECLDAATPLEKEITLKLFFEYNKEKLKSSKRPWTLPRIFGGLGLPYSIFGANPSSSEILLAISQLDDYKNLADIPLKYTFNEISDERLIDLAENSTLFLNSFYNIESRIIKQEVIGCGNSLTDVKPLPSLAPFVLDPNESNKIYETVKGKNGKLIRKRKIPEFNYIKAKKNANKKVKFFIEELKLFKPEFLVETLQQCKLQKAGSFPEELEITWQSH
jgi:hypothetical protein